MPDKGIIVGSIDVSECEFLWKEKLPKMFCNNGNLDCDCNSNPNCIFRQLKAKEQEVKKYKQALDEIAERENSVCDACKKFTPNKASDITCGYCEVTQIRNIIDKAKER